MTVFAVPTKRLSNGFNLGGSVMFKSTICVLDSVVTVFSVGSRVFLVYHLVRKVKISFLGITSVTVIMSTFDPRRHNGTVKVGMAKICLTASASPMVKKFLGFRLK